MDRLIKAVCPEMPQDKIVGITHDRVSWYKVNVSSRTLYVPPMNVLRENPFELDKFIESLKTFAISDLSAREYDWEHLHLEQYSGADCLEGIARIRELCIDKVVACDIETRRLEWEDNILLSIGFAVTDDTCIALYDIPIKGARHEGEFGDARVYEALQELLNDEDYTFIWQNGKFDCGKLWYLCKIVARVDEDTQLFHYARINEKKGTHGLKDLGQLYLQAPAWDDELEAIKRQWCRESKALLEDFMYDDIPIEVLIPYMQRDCIATRRLLHKFQELAQPGTEFVYRTLIEASEAYMQIELNGMRVDMDYLGDLEYDLDREIEVSSGIVARASEKIWNAVKYAKDTKAKTKPSEPFNPRSPKQLKWILEEILGYALPNTKAETIDDIVENLDSLPHVTGVSKDFVNGLGAWRKNNKYMDTYVQGFRSVLCGDLRVRGTLNLHGTETGRLSSSGPNMQNIPRDTKVKNLIICEPGNILLQLDYSQAELRVLAMLSDDPFMLEAYNAGKDFHDAIATDMFGPDFTKEQRNQAKTINFGIAYGRGPSSISEKFHKSMQEAQAIINKWYQPMPKVKEFINKRRKMAQHGDPCITLFGRERHFVVTNENLYHVQNEYINTPIQSVASDLTMLSLLAIHKYITEENVAAQAKIVITVHDSLILEMPDNKVKVDEVAKRCLEIMAQTPKKFIPDCKVIFKADADVGYKWGNLHKWVEGDKIDESVSTQS